MDKFEETQVSRDEVVVAMCRMLDPMTRKGELDNENAFGVDVWYSRKDPYGMLFRFITHDLMEVTLHFDLKELETKGRRYIDERVEIITENLERARQERFEDDERLVLTIPSDIEPTARAVNEVIH